MSDLDKFNRIILRELQQNGRISNTDLAEKIGLSPSACLRRVQDLESKGIISGYRAILNNQRLGIGFIAYVGVGLNKHSTESQTDFESAIKLAPQVKECHNVTGAIEYLLRIETEDLKAFKVFHADILGNIPQVSTISTHVVMDSPKDERK